MALSSDMNFFGIRAPADMLKKLEREYVRLKSGCLSDGSQDHAYNFFWTAHHIEDYLEKTKAIPKKVLEDFVSDQDMLDCRDLCDKFKHYSLTHSNRVDPTIWTYTGEIGGAPVGVLEVGAGDKRMMFSGSREIGVDWLADRVMQKWRDFFVLHDLLPKPS